MHTDDAFVKAEVECSQSVSQLRHIAKDTDVSVETAGKLTLNCRFLSRRSWLAISGWLVKCDVVYEGFLWLAPR